MGNFALLIDLDGTVYSGGAAIPGAAESVRRLAAAGIPHLFVTNNSSRPPEAVAAALQGFGVPCAPEQVVTTAEAAAEYVAGRSPGAKVYAVGEAGLRSALAAAGLALVEDEPAEYVVQGIDREFTYRKLAAAVSQLLGGAAYVQTNPDRLLPWDGGYLPGAGAIGAAIREASGKEPVVIGKPSDRLMRYALRRLPAGCEVWVVGDNPYTDVAAGAAAGLRTALVRTGLLRAYGADGPLPAGAPEPDLVCADLPELLERLGL